MDAGILDRFNKALSTESPGTNQEEAVIEERQPQEQAVETSAQANADDDQGNESDVSDETGDTVTEQDPIDEETFETLEEVAEAAGMTIDQFMKSIKLADSNGEKITLEDIRSRQLMHDDYTRKTQKLAEERNAFEYQRQEYANQIQQRVQSVESVLQTLETKLLDDFNGINWEALKLDDPTEWAVKRQEFEDKRVELANARQRANQETQRIMSEQQAQQQAQYNQMVSQQMEMTKKAIPEWSDSKVARKELGEISEYLSNTLGVSAEEFNSVIDHRMFVLSRKAMLYDQLSNKAEVAKKEVKKAPRLVKGGTAKPKVNPQTESYAKAKNNLKKSGKVTDAAAALRHLF